MYIKLSENTSQINDMSTLNGSLLLNKSRAIIFSTVVCRIKSLRLLYIFAGAIGKSIYFKVIKGLNSRVGYEMRLQDVACFLIFIVGVALFLYGANYYDAFVGWTGVALMVGGFFAEIFLKVYEVLSKREK
jgi:hypothetical protein